MLNAARSRGRRTMRDRTAVLLTGLLPYSAAVSLIVDAIAHPTRHSRAASVTADAVRSDPPPGPRRAVVLHRDVLAVAPVAAHRRPHPGATARFARSAGVTLAAVPDRRSGHAPQLHPGG